MLDNPFDEEISLNIQSNIPAQAETTSFNPITCNLFHAVVESGKTFPETPFLQAKNHQFFQPLLKLHVHLTLHQLCCLS